MTKQIVPAPLFPLSYHHLDADVILPDAIEDRGSRYTISAFVIQEEDDIQKHLQVLDPGATHNSFAWRLLQSDGSIWQDSNDDGETGAGQVILRELIRYQAVDMLLVVTRYFGGIKLETDRYKHIVDGCRMVLEKLG